jgi:hypothetical protein
MQQMDTTYGSATRGSFFIAINDDSSKISSLSIRAQGSFKGFAKGSSFRTGGENG